jgi:hypothetical protein
LVYVLLNGKARSQHSNPAIGSNRAVTITGDTSIGSRYLSEKTSNISATKAFNVTSTKKNKLKTIR